MLLSGESHLSLDDKGRLAIPARFRDGLRDSCASQLMSVIDPASNEQRLLLYPLNEWTAVVEQLKGMPNADPMANRFKNLFVGRSVPVEVDKQGRILLPPKHREHVRLDARVVLVGQITKFEVWEEQAWNDYCGGSRDGLDLTALDEGSPLRTLSY
ncbi:MAG: division/cell wall cluster transcriptional repressor MraZ [Gammaproteobacteria bacterium]|nr:division/cell wall cluster transcriptional repressor MraZ [Gammaproteobacteria bacterium]MBU1654200.1 division/cell wall cluster transcriptional repressor MraZ [Gammaproteobacteria bacterium]MBU1960860.1 division/cell wall cluster transcriptional repressor MraZ [Gammaproteobacteria bacterium]